MTCSPRRGQAARVAVVRRAVERQGRQVGGAEELADRAEQGVLLLGADVGRGQLVLVVRVGVLRARSAACPRRSWSRGSWRAFTTAPTSPLSPATPDSALSNLLTSSIWRTPSLRTSSSWVSMDAGSHSGTSPPGSRLKVQPNGTLVSMPMITAILPGVDHPAGLPRAAHDPVEALAGTAELGVDVVLQLVHVLRLQADRVHVVAGVVLDRVELAELVVLDEQVDEDPLPAAPRALEPAVVGALVGQRLRRRPVLERRPADRVVGRARRTGRPRARRRCRRSAVWSGQSTRAYGAPYSSHGLPQWTSPPRNSKAMPCVCASTYPRTSWIGVMPAIGAPVMPIWDSG